MGNNSAEEPLFSAGWDGPGTSHSVAQECVRAIRKAMPHVKVWPWITHASGAHPPRDAVVMRKLFENPFEFVKNATEAAVAWGIDGWNIDFEATGEAPNRNDTFWQQTLRFTDYFSKQHLVHGIKTSVAIMCTPNVTAPGLCQNGLPFFNNSASEEDIRLMQSSSVQRFVSMGTYGENPIMLQNSLDWFLANLGPEKFGYGACPSCTPPSQTDNTSLADRFVAAHARGVVEMDLFAYRGRDDGPNWTDKWWDMARRYLQCGESILEGQCWPYS